jgi:hypothetical protein
MSCSVRGELDALMEWEAGTGSIRGQGGGRVCQSGPDAKDRLLSRRTPEITCMA